MPDDVNEIGADERVVEIEMERLREFRNHPFKVKADQQIQRYLKIAELTPELLVLLDDGVTAFNPAYEAAFLKEDEQKLLVQAMDYAQASPSISQTQRIKNLSKEGRLTLDKMQDILSEVKKGEINRVIFKNEQLYQYFPKGYTPDQMKKEFDLRSIFRKAGC